MLQDYFENVYMYILYVNFLTTVTMVINFLDNMYEQLYFEDIDR